MLPQAKESHHQANRDNIHNPVCPRQFYHHLVHKLVASLKGIL